MDRYNQELGSGLWGAEHHVRGALAGITKDPKTGGFSARS